jgi:hypothetical protein
VPDESKAAAERLHDALRRRDAGAVRSLLQHHSQFSPLINEPVFNFNAPAIVAFANDAAMVDVLLEFGADPNRRSDWWAADFTPYMLRRERQPNDSLLAAPLSTPAVLRISIALTS